MSTGVSTPSPELIPFGHMLAFLDCQIACRDLYHADRDERDEPQLLVIRLDEMYS